MAVHVYPLNHQYNQNKELLNTLTVETINGLDYIRCKDIFYYSQMIIKNISNKDLQVNMYKLTYFICTEVECTELEEEKHIPVNSVIDGIHDYIDGHNCDKGFLNLCNIILNELELIREYEGR